MARNRYTKKRYGAYWMALGEFAYYFSKVEYAMMRTLIIFTRVREPIAKAVYSGTRIRTAISFIRRASEETGKTIPAEVDEAFSKIAMINTQRDRLFHYGFEIDENENAFVSDLDRNITSKAINEPIGVEDLKNLSRDTVTCWARLVVFNHAMLRVPHPSQEAWENAAKRPWRYKQR